MEDDALDLMADWSSDEHGNADLMADWDSDHETALSIVPIVPAPVPEIVPATAIVQSDAKVHDNAKVHSFRPISKKGELGSGRHGTRFERRLLMMHARSEKSRRQRLKFAMVVHDLFNGTEFSRDSASFKLCCKISKKRATGVSFILRSASKRGNRHVRLLPFKRFRQAAFGKNCSNVAIASAVGVNPTTVPKLQKTVASVFMVQQAKMLGRILMHCQANKPMLFLK